MVRVRLVVIVLACAAALACLMWDRFAPSLSSTSGATAVLAFRPSTPGSGVAQELARATDAVAAAGREVARKVDESLDPLDWRSKYAGATPVQLAAAAAALEASSDAELERCAGPFPKLTFERRARLSSKATFAISVRVTTDSGRTWERASGNGKPVVYRFAADAATSARVRDLDREASWLRSRIGAAAPTPTAPATEIIQLGY